MRFSCAGMPASIDGATRARCRNDSAPHPGRSVAGTPPARSASARMAPRPRVRTANRAGTPMIEISTANLLAALAVTTAAGLATGVGGLLVFAQKQPNARLLAFGLAFAGGAMVYVSLSEILNKSVLSFTEAYGDRMGFSLGTAAFLAGVGLIMLVVRLVPKPHERLEVDDPFFREHNPAYIRRVGLL